MADYDPNKRREYYLRTRELKGRSPGLGPVEGMSSSGSSSGGGGTKTAPKKEVAKSTSSKSVTEKKIELMKARLKKLRATIKKLVAEAKQRSGVKDAPTKAATTSKKPEQKLTAKQKADAAKRSKEHYEKNKEPSQAEELKSLQKQIDNATERIKKLKKDAAEAKKGLSKGQSQKATTKK